MTAVCFYFQAHQPYRLRKYDFFDIGCEPVYFDEERNREILERVSAKCYLPATNLLLELCERYGDDFRLSFSLTGVLLEQLRAWQPAVLDNFKRLADTGRVEFLAETYYHSLAGLFSEREFAEQVRLHSACIRKHLGFEPVVFRNTELIHSDDIARRVKRLGFSGVLLEGTGKLLHWRSADFVYESAVIRGLRYLLRNYRLSDDIAFRFSSGEPLFAEQFAGWLHSGAEQADVINLFMDFETFGEHQWAATGIFGFLEALPGWVLRHSGFRFRTVSDVLAECPVAGGIECESLISWADEARDVSAWLGNSMQKQATEAVYELEERVREAGDAGLLDVFRRLQCSDLFYYMSTKGAGDGAVHSYFNPYGSPHDAYIYYMNVLQDFRQRLPGLG